MSSALVQMKTECIFPDANDEFAGIPESITMVGISRICERESNGSLISSMLPYRTRERIAG